MADVKKYIAPKKKPEEVRTVEAAFDGKKKKTKNGRVLTNIGGKRPGHLEKKKGSVRLHAHLRLTGEF